MASIGIEYGLTASLERRLALLQSEIHREKVSMQYARLSEAGATAVSEMDQFYRFFPLQPALSDLLRQIYSEAAAHGLSLERGDYQYAPEPGLSLARYRISLPVRGTYPQIKAFVVVILDAQPYLVLDGIRLTREQVSAQSIEARLQFSLLVDAR